MGTGSLLQWYKGPIPKSHVNSPVPRVSSDLSFKISLKLIRSEPRIKEYPITKQTINKIHLGLAE